MNKHLIIIDGNSLLFRAYYATAYAGVEKIMRTSTGVPTNAIFAFSNMVVKIVNDLKPDDHLFVAFDTGEKTFRHDKYDDYKAGRQKVPEELIVQFPIAREFLDALSIKHYEINGYEADDLAGSLAKKAGAEGFAVDLYTSDHDYFQLIDDHISVKLIKKGLSEILTLTRESLYETYGFYPEQVTAFKGLTGDASDNLKGVPGVGQVTAIKLLKEYQNLATILENSAQIKGKLGENLLANTQTALETQHLATIVTTVPLTKPLSYYEYHGFDHETLRYFAQKYELRTLLNKITYRPTLGNIEISYREITTTNGLDLTSLNEFAFYLDGEMTNYYDAVPAFMYFKYNADVYRITFSNLVKDSGLKDVLKSSNITKISYDIKRAAIILINNNLVLSGEYEDVALMAYLNDSDANNSLDSLLRINGINYLAGEESINATFINFIPQILSKEKEKLQAKNLLNLYLTIEKPLISVLIKMEKEGFPVNKKILDEIGEDYKATLELLSQKIYQAAGYTFNINSSQQIAKLLFDDLGLPANKKRSTAIDVLNYLNDKHPVVALILEYRKYQKIISTYIDGLLPHIKSDGKIHTSFNQLQTTTGRLSSTNPNLQNISVRNEEGREVRKAFNAENNTLLCLDYSQIELRLLACIAEEKTLIQVFNDERDIHAETSSRLFPLEDIDYARRKAKAVNFGIVYGISDFGLAEQLGVGFDEARGIITSFYENYPAIRTYRENIIKQVQNTSFVETLTGRKRYLPQINDTNYQTREFAKRAAMNAPIQGSAADLIKLAMIKIDHLLSSGNYKTKLILQVHDELIFSLDAAENELVDKLVAIMENVFDLPLKLKVGVKRGKTWFDAS